MSDETIARPADGSDPHAVHRRTLPPGTPRFIGRYEVLRILGGGTFGRVYLAFDPNIERYVAIKLPILPPESHRDFLREARIVAQLHHPNICPVYDVGTQDNLPFIVMRYVGGTLDGLLACGLLAPDRALRIAGQIAKGLEAAHTREIFHRDLKPANVLFDEEADEMLLTDFGIARWLESSSQTTDGVKGTPAYMAPEQWDREFGPISARTDVYSLGVVLFRLLTGVQLFPGESAQQMFAHCFTPPRRPSEVRPDLDARFDDLCLKSLAKQPAERYQSAKEFASAIAAYLRPPASVSPPVPVPLPPRQAPAVPVARSPNETVEFPLPQGLQMVFCWIPPGTSMLGSPESEKDRHEDEVEHEYTNAGFWLGKYQVTQAEWQAVMGNNPSHFQSDRTSRFPVEQVSWKSCQEFLKKLTSQGGIERVFGKAGVFALPHEDMWEYACRGGLGNKQPFHFGEQLNGTQANCDGNFPYGTCEKGARLGHPTQVGSYESKFRHPWGLCDMHGNVWEWCENLCDKTIHRVLRGGAWDDDPKLCRAARRYGFVPTGRGSRFGFRVCFRVSVSAWTKFISIFSYLSPREARRKQLEI